MATAPSYMAPGSEFDLAQQQAARQHLLAQSLMQQSQQPLQGQMAGQYYAAPSWTQGLAKMLQAYSSGKINQQADQSLLDARSAYDTRNLNSSNDFMDKLTGTPSQSFQAPSNDASDTSQVTRPAAAADPDAALKIAMQNPQNPTLAGMGQSMLANKLSLAQTQNLFNMATGGNSTPAQPPGAILPGMGEFLSKGAQPASGGAPVADGNPQAASTPQTGSPFAGVTPMAARLMMTGNPGLIKIGEAIQAANSPTDFIKTLRAAGIDENSAIGRQLLQANIAKTNNIPLQSGRPGAPMYDAQGNVIAMAPKIPDNAIPQIENGKITGVSQLLGAPAIQQSNAKATAMGGAEVAPTVVYGPDNKPIFSTKAQDVKRAEGIAVAPGSAEPDQRLAATIQADAVANGIKNPVSNFRGNGNVATQSSGQYSPQLAPGTAAFLDKQGAASADRASSLVKDAAESPTRINVLDNILNLSTDGVKTGPTANFTNKMKGYAADALNIKSWKDDVSGFQEMNKFLAQNANRAWQAAGGTGTDAQLEQQVTANMQNKMFPQALQTMAKWAKAGEIALQAKNQAQQAAGINNPAAQTQFDTAWQSNMDPRLFQLKLMAPAEANAYVANLKTSNPNEYATLMQKAQGLKKLGGL